MTRHAEAIINKMENSDYPEFNTEFVYKLANESERGAILIGASKVEEYLRELILRVLPSNNKKYTSKLLEYPGPMSSFSGKIELCHAFRVIDVRVYNSLNTLRKIRNEAAHSNKSFSLQSIKNELEKIYDFEDYFPGMIHELTYNNLIEFKKHKVKQILIEKNYSHQSPEELWDQIVSKPETNDAIQNQLTIWKLAYGLVFLCYKIEVIKDEYKID